MNSALPGDPPRYAERVLRRRSTPCVARAREARLERRSTIVNPMTSSAIVLGHEVSAPKTSRSDERLLALAAGPSECAAIVDHSRHERPPHLILDGLRLRARLWTGRCGSGTVAFCSPGSSALNFLACDRWADVRITSE